VGIVRQYVCQGWGGTKTYLGATHRSQTCNQEGVGSGCSFVEGNYLRPGPHRPSPSIHPSIHPSIPPSLHPSIHPSIPPSVSYHLTTGCWLLRQDSTPVRVHRFPGERLPGDISAKDKAGRGRDPRGVVAGLLPMTGLQNHLSCPG